MPHFRFLVQEKRPYTAWCSRKRSLDSRRERLIQLTTERTQFPAIYQTYAKNFQWQGGLMSYGAKI